MKLVGLVFSVLVSGLILNSFYTSVHAHNFYQNQALIFFKMIHKPLAHVKDNINSI